MQFALNSPRGSVELGFELLIERKISVIFAILFQSSSKELFLTTKITAKLASATPRMEGATGD